MAIRSITCGVAILGMMALASAQTTTSTVTYKDDLMQSMESMHHGMSADKITGDPDVDFLLLMIPHHQGAVDMARIELKYGKDPQLKAMARKIIEAQEDEISQMQAHLKRRGVETTGTATSAGGGLSTRSNAMPHEMPAHH